MIELKRYRKPDGYPTRHWGIYVDGELLAGVLHWKGGAGDCGFYPHHTCRKDGERCRVSKADRTIPPCPTPATGKRGSRGIPREAVVGPHCHHPYDCGRGSRERQGGDGGFGDVDRVSFCLATLGLRRGYVRRLQLFVGNRCLFFLLRGLRQVATHLAVVFLIRSRCASAFDDQRLQQRLHPHDAFGLLRCKVFAFTNVTRQVVELNGL